jgi:Papain family cysteine protease
MVGSPLSGGIEMRWSRRWGVAILAVCAAGCGQKKGAGGSGTSTTPGSTAAATSREGQRPPKPTPIASVTPPKLPKLAAQAAHVAPPKSKAAKDEAPCGTVWTGEEEVPLECEAVTADTHPGAPAVALVPYNMLRAPRADLPTTVDHRLDGFEGRTLAQGKAGTCTAFTLTSQIDHAIGLWTGKPGDVSPMQIWARYHTGGNAARANLGLTVANDADWPYDAARAMAWSKCKRGDTSCLTDDERKKLDELEKKGVAVLEEVENLPEDDTLFDIIEAKLAAGRDVGTGGKLPKGFKPVGDAGSKYVPEFAEVGTGAHAFSLVGYTHVDSERYFLVKNSWGPRWGDGGYAWIHEQSLRKIAHHGYVVIVDLVTDKGLRRTKRKRGAVAACAAGQAPDSVDGACKPLCRDGGPRHGGYCGTTEDCARGLVNVAGYCVLAAPAAKGTEPKTGITFACAPSGCVYTIPKGAPGCAGATCQKSCPAPDFRLGKGKSGLLCLE